MCVLRGLWWSVHECFRYTSTQASVSTASFLFFSSSADLFQLRNEPHCVPTCASQMTGAVFFLLIINSHHALPYNVNRISGACHAFPKTG